MDAKRCACVPIAHPLHRRLHWSADSTGSFWPVQDEGGPRLGARNLSFRRSQWLGLGAQSDRPVVAYSVEELGSRSRARDSAKLDLSDRSRIDDSDLGRGVEVPLRECRSRDASSFQRNRPVVAVRILGRQQTFRLLKAERPVLDAENSPSQPFADFGRPQVAARPGLLQLHDRLRPIAEKNEGCSVPLLRATRSYAKPSGSQSAVLPRACSASKATASDSMDSRASGASMRRPRERYRDFACAIASATVSSA